jgi:N-acetylneuraminic acid mutarotase
MRNQLPIMNLSKAGKILGLAFGLSLLSFFSDAQNVWVKKTAPSTPFTARNACSGFAIGTKGYFGLGGDAAGPRVDWYSYDPSLDTWTAKAAFAGGARQAAVSFSIGTKGYVGLGDNATGALSDFWEYDSATDTWTKKADYPGGKRTTAIGFSIGTKGYVGCGDSVPGLTKTFYEYDPATNTWTRKADFGGTGRSDASAFSIGAKGYVVGGDDGTVPFKKDFWEYDPALNTWTQKADFTGGPRTTATGFALNGLGYFGSGDDGANLHNDMWAWDPVGNAWSAIAAFPGTKRSDMTVVIIGSKAYAGNGNQCGASCYINDWYEYTPGALGIFDYSKDLVKISLFPNLIRDNVTINYENLNGANAKFLVFDALGKNVASYNLSNSTHLMTLDLSYLANGLYYYKVFSNEALSSGGKFVVAK